MDIQKGGSELKPIWFGVVYFRDVIIQMIQAIKTMVVGEFLFVKDGANLRTFLRIWESALPD